MRSDSPLSETEPHLSCAVLILAVVALAVGAGVLWWLA